MDLIHQISQRLSIGLNKPYNENLTLALIRFYLNDNSPQKFTTYLAALGVKDVEFTNEVYRSINSNIGKLEKAINEKAARIESPSEKPSLSTTTKDKAAAPQTAKAKRPLKISLDDFDAEDDGALDLSIRSSSIPKAKPLTDMPISKPKFKKIKKERANQIKEETNGMKSEKHEQADGPIEIKEHQSESAQPPPKPLSLSELAEIERKVSTPASTPSVSSPASVSTPGDDLFSSNDPADIENDREWYTNEEFGQVAQDFDDYEEDIEPVQQSQQQRSVATPKNTFRNRPSGGNGGTFDQKTGEYIDFDHEDSSNSRTDLSRIPITSHYLVPPFLKEFSEHLSVVEFGTDSKSIGPMVDPVKDAQSELAVAARQGSVVVKERKSRREKAKQAREKAGIQGTKLGNVLGVEDAVDEEKKPDEDGEVDDDSTESAAPVKSIQYQRKFLPVFSVRNQLLQSIADNQVLIVVGETGSGKTTQLTQYLHEEGYTVGNKMVGCTQPRRVAAMSVAKRVSEEMACKVGAEVGYTIRFEDYTSPKTIIKYLTEGILLREILTDPTLSSYSCIIMDEAHERSLNTDVLLGLFKTTVLPKRRDLKLIITSATMNADRFSRFFGDAPQFEIPGRTYPVDVLYSRSSSIDYVETAAKQVLSIHLSKWLENKGVNDGDILVFMTGQEDIEVTVDCIKEKLELLDDPPPIDVYPIYSTMPADLQQKIFRKLNKKRRKCIVATNIAETSLTVDGIKYVVDSGLTKVKVYNAKLGMDTLTIVPVSLANAQQRSGRAGRTGPGNCFRLFTERAIAPEQMYAQPIPEIQRTNLSNVSLMLKSLKVGDAKNNASTQISDFPFLDPPPADLLACSLYELWSIGALDNFGELTPLGESMNEFPMEPNLAKLILLSVRPEFQCSEEIITIVSMLSVPSCYFRPKERAQEADLARDKFTISESDHLTFLNIFRQWEAVPFRKRDAWCTRNFFHSRSLARAYDIKQQLSLIMRKNRLSLFRAREDEDIRKCLCAAYFAQSAKLVKTNVSKSGSSGAGAEYFNLRHTYMKMYLHPTSSINSEMSPPVYVIYHELILTTKEYMSCVTAVDPLWLLEFGYVFFGVNNVIQNKINGKVKLISKGELEAQLSDDDKKYIELKQRSKVKKRKVFETGRIKASNRGF